MYEPQFQPGQRVQLRFAGNCHGKSGDHAVLISEEMKFSRRTARVKLDSGEVTNIAPMFLRQAPEKQALS